MNTKLVRATDNVRVLVYQSFESADEYGASQWLGNPKTFELWRTSSWDHAGQVTMAEPGDVFLLLSEKVSLPGAQQNHYKVLYDKTVGWINVSSDWAFEEIEE